MRTLASSNVLLQRSALMDVPSRESVTCYLHDVSQQIVKILRILPVDMARLEQIANHRVCADADGNVHFASGGEDAWHAVEQTVTKHNLRYSLWCLRSYARWLTHHLKLNPRMSVAERIRALSQVANTPDAHDTHGRPLYVGDVIDSSVLFAPLGIHQFSHSSIYLGGGFVAHTILDRSSVKWGMKNAIHQALALALPTFMCSVFTVARKCDMNVHGFVYSRTSTVREAVRKRQASHLAVGMDTVPESFEERWTRVGCAVASTGIYGYNLPRANCQHFVNSICGGQFVSQTTQRVSFFFACLCAAAILILLVCITAYTHGRRRHAPCQTS